MEGSQRSIGARKEGPVTRSGTVDRWFTITKKNLGATFVSKSGLFVTQFTTTSFEGHIEKITPTIGGDPVLTFRLTLPMSTSDLTTVVSTGEISAYSNGANDDTMTTCYNL